MAFCKGSLLTVMKSYFSTGYLSLVDHLSISCCPSGRELTSQCVCKHGVISVSMVAPRLKRQKQKTSEFAASLGYTLSCLKVENKIEVKKKKRNPPK